MPFDTETLNYNSNTHQYFATIDGVKNRLNVNLDKELGSYKEAEVFLRQATDRVYRWLYSYIRREGVRILEKRIADNFTPEQYGLPYREGIENAIYAQIEYMLNFDGDLEAQAQGNKDMLCSTEAKQILHYYGIAHKGPWADFIDPTEFRVGY
jgi:hypothetical protein